MNKKEMNNKQSDLQKRYPKRKKTGDKQQDEPEMESENGSETEMNEMQKRNPKRQKMDEKQKEPEMVSDDGSETEMNDSNKIDDMENNIERREEIANIPSSSANGLTIDEDGSDFDIDVDEIENMRLITYSKIDDLENFDQKEQIINLEGYLTQITKPILVKGSQEHTKEKSFWQKNLILSNEELTQKIKITLWDDLVHQYNEIQLYDVAKFRNLKIKVDKSHHNWGTSTFVGSASQRNETEMQVTKTISFNYSKLQFRKLDDPAIYSNNYKAKVIKVVNETNVFVAKVATKQGQLTIRFWKNENPDHEIVKVQKNKIYAFIGVWGSLEPDNTMIFSMYRSGRVFEL